MPDITMCLDKRCPSRKKCYRFTAERNTFYQSFSDFGRLPKMKKCPMFWGQENKWNPDNK